MNGTGKSSLTGVLKAETVDLGKIINVDKLNIEYGSARLGGKAAIKLIQECIENDVSFTQETTLSSHKAKSTAKLAREHNYLVRLYYVGLSYAAESIKRIANRVQKGGYNIPPEDVERRFKSRFSDIAGILPYCNEATFYDNENGFRVVAEYRNGELITLGETFPAWITELKEHLAHKI